MQLSSERRGAALVVTVTEPRIDAAAAIQFRDGMRALTARDAGPVLLDLGQVDFIDSSGLGAIVGALKQLPERASLDLVALRPNVDKVFRLTRMDTIFRIHDDLDTALSVHAG